MDKNGLIYDLVTSIRCLGIDFRAVDHLDTVAVINPSKQQGAYDINTATPFDIAHELFHALHHDVHRLAANDVRNPQERDANAAATKYLWNLYLNNGGTEEYIQHFVDVSGVPAYRIERLLLDDSSLNGVLFSNTNVIY